MAGRARTAGLRMRKRGRAANTAHDVVLVPQLTPQHFIRAAGAQCTSFRPALLVVSASRIASPLGRDAPQTYSPLDRHTWKLVEEEADQGG